MPETTQNRPLMRTVTYGTFQAYYFKRVERREGEIREEERVRQKKRKKERNEITQPEFQAQKNSG